MTQLPRQSDGVGWEMVIRWPWEDDMKAELRAIDKDTVELVVSMKVGNSLGTWTEVKSRRVLIADLRAALDELERSAKEVERL
jgi:hypothetical protein